MRQAPVARRYAKALHALAVQEGRLEPIAQDLLRFDRVLADDAALREVLLRPWVQAGTKRTVVTAVTERLELSLLTRNFLGLLAQRRRLTLLPEVIAAYRALVDEAAGRARARVRSATPLTDAQRAAIR